MSELQKNLTHLMQYRNQVDELAFSELMSQILSGFPSIGWELGVALDKPNIDQLSLSVRDSPNLVEKLMSELKVPIEGSGWRIDIGIPPRDWDIYFEVNTGTTILRIEGRSWFWSMNANDKSCELNFIVPIEQAMAMTGKELIDVAEVIAVGELGEMNLITFVSSIKVKSMDTTPLEYMPLIRLREKFSQIYPRCNYSKWLTSSRREA